jgi:undecaprenyl pyrophosphate phosphatase UppP
LSAPRSSATRREDFIRYLGDHSIAVFAWYRLALAAATVIVLLVLAVGRT